MTPPNFIMGKPWRYQYEVMQSNYGAHTYAIVDNKSNTDNGPGIIAYTHTKAYAIRIVQALNFLKAREDEDD